MVKTPYTDFRKQKRSTVVLGKKSTTIKIEGRHLGGKITSTLKRFPIKKLSFTAHEQQKIG